MVPSIGDPVEPRSLSPWNVPQQCRAVRPGRFLNGGRWRRLSLMWVRNWLLYCTFPRDIVPIGFPCSHIFTRLPGPDVVTLAKELRSQCPYGGFQSMGVPPNGWFIMGNPLKKKLMIWRYPHFRKPPFDVRLFHEETVQLGVSPFQETSICWVEMGWSALTKAPGIPLCRPLDFLLLQALRMTMLEMSRICGLCNWNRLTP